MKAGDGTPGKARRASYQDGPAIQVICLGSGGGPDEDNVTAFLVRSTSSNWSKGSILAVDAGSHLSAITRILSTDFPLVSEARARDEQDQTHSGADSSTASSRSSSPDPPPTLLKSGPFAGLPFPNLSARANALHVVREHISTYLITHPHLDHVSGFVINTASFHNTSRPKKLAALPFTVNAIKTHIFNDIMWPNLTDEDGGVGFVTFQRLAEGGNIALGEGHGRGFIEVCEGLSAKGFRVSHGTCTKVPPYIHRGSGSSNLTEQPSNSMANISTAMSREGRSLSFSMQSQPGTPHNAQNEQGAIVHQQCVVDSTAYFIRAEPPSYSSSVQSREILIFGDVEPDSLSQNPRTALVWAEAAPKIAAGILNGIFIECSYNDSQADAVLFGHLAPRHLIVELLNLAEMVREARKDLEREREETRKGRKRKRASNSFMGADSQHDVDRFRRTSRSRQRGLGSGPTLASASTAESGPMTPTPGPAEDHMKDYFPHNGSPLIVSHLVTSPGTATPSDQTLALGSSMTNAALRPGGGDTGDAPLRGLKIVIIHVKDTLMDGPLVCKSIKEQLDAHEAQLSQQGKGLGCEFIISQSGASYWF